MVKGRSPIRELRASGIARRRTNEERAQAVLLCERRRRRRVPKPDARPALKIAQMLQLGKANRRNKEERVR
jgi:hypothetical protein